MTQVQKIVLSATGIKAESGFTATHDWTSGWNEPDSFVSMEARMESISIKPSVVKGAINPGNNCCPGSSTTLAPSAETVAPTAMILSPSMRTEPLVIEAPLTVWTTAGLRRKRSAAEA